MREDNEADEGRPASPSLSPVPSLAALRAFTHGMQLTPVRLGSVRFELCAGVSSSLSQRSDTANEMKGGGGGAWKWACV